MKSSVRSSYPASGSVTRERLVARLGEQADEIGKAIYAHVSPLAEAVEREDDDPEYAEGRRVAIAELVECALVSLEQPPGQLGPSVPLEAAMQARRAARKGVSLGTVIRRYVAGEKLLARFVMEVGDDLPAQELWSILASQAPPFDALLEVVTSEYTDEVARIERFPRLRLRRCVDALLAGHSFVRTPDLGYDLDAWHLGVILTGIRPEVAVHSLATALGSRPLVVPRDDGVVWAWLGSATELSVGDVEQAIHTSMLEDASVAIGDPRKGIEGWRVTHREALAGFRVMLRRPQKVIRGSKVILLAAVLRDEGLVEALRQTYIAPLDEEGGSERVLPETLRAYFSTGGNAVTAAALLGVNRQTVQRRIRRIEERLGRLLPTCQAELEVALSVDQLYRGTEKRRREDFAESAP
jgi:PucR C-terminal helix-turn-helix domain/GGDEF-like domain